MDLTPKVDELLKLSYGAVTFRGSKCTSMTPTKAVAKEDGKVSDSFKEEFASAIAVLESQITDIRTQLDGRIQAVKESIALALTAADKTTQIAQDTADKAVAKAEAAAGKEYLESRIEGLRNSVVEQIIAQKEAISAALKAAQDALTAALASSEKAISKAEEANEKRFQSVNEFRAQLGDQQRTFVVATEANFKFNAIEKKFDELALWQRRTDQQFNSYLATETWNSTMNAWTEWRRTVDAALTTAQSKNAIMYSIFAMAVAVGGLALTAYNLFKSSS